MLILERRIGESLTIGNTTKVVVLSIQGNKVRLGVNAPRNIIINRAEVQKQQEAIQCSPQA